MLDFQTLQWKLSPVTVVHWLAVYLQLIEFASTLTESATSEAEMAEKREKAKRFHLPNYHRSNFLQLCQVC